MTEAISLRPRRLYRRPAGRWVGFGRAVVEQPDLFEAEYRVGRWIVGVCRVCLVAKINELRGLVDMVDKGLKARVAALRTTTETEGSGAMDTVIAEPCSISPIHERHENELSQDQRDTDAGTVSDRGWQRLGDVAGRLVERFHRD